MQIFILTEGGQNIGLGHIARCTAIEQGFKDKHLEVRWILKADKSITSSLKNMQLVDWLKDKEEILSSVKDADIAIIDSYLLDRSFYTEIAKVVKLPVYLDDNVRLDYPRGIVVNGSLEAKSLNYSLENKKTGLLGSDYIPLRSEFWNVQEKRNNQIIKSVMITFGGDDSKEMTVKILKVLCDHYPDLVKNIVIGKFFSNIPDIKAMKNGKTNFFYAPDAQTMKKIMLDSDIAISAAGQTLYELARVGTPTIAVAVAENQMNNVKGWSKTGFVEYAGWWEDKDLMQKILKNVEILKPYEVRLRYANIGITVVDGKGVSRIIDSLLKEFSDEKK